MYREQWVSDILNGRTLLECALDVRMSANGSFERSRSEQGSLLSQVAGLADGFNN